MQCAEQDIEETWITAEENKCKTVSVWLYIHLLYSKGLSASVS